MFPVFSAWRSVLSRVLQQSMLQAARSQYSLHHRTAGGKGLILNSFWLHWAQEHTAGPVALPWQVPAWGSLHGTAWSLPGAQLPSVYGSSAPHPLHTSRDKGSSLAAVVAGGLTARSLTTEMY